MGPDGSARRFGWVNGNVNFNESINQTNFLVQIGTYQRAVGVPFMLWQNDGPTPTQTDRCESVNGREIARLQSSIAEMIVGGTEHRKKVTTMQELWNYETPIDYSIFMSAIAAHPPILLLFPIVGSFIFAIIRFGMGTHLISNDTKITFQWNKLTCRKIVGEKWPSRSTTGVISNLFLILANATHK